MTIYGCVGDPALVLYCDLQILLPFALQTEALQSPTNKARLMWTSFISLVECGSPSVAVVGFFFTLCFYLSDEVSSPVIATFRQMLLSNARFSLDKINNENCKQLPIDVISSRFRLCNWLFWKLFPWTNSSTTFQRFTKTISGLYPVRIPISRH